MRKCWRESWFTLKRVESNSRKHRIDPESKYEERFGENRTGISLYAV